MRRFICAAVLPLLVVLGACAAEQEQAPVTSDMTTTTYDTVAATYGPDIYDINESIDEAYLASVGARVLSKKLMLYSDYLAQYSPDSRDHTIGDDQHVWVVQTFFPEFDTIKDAKFKNATTISLYDAETGFYYGYSVQGEEEVFHAD